MNNNKQNICHIAKKLEPRIKDKKILKNHLNNCIYSETQQIRSVIIIDKESSIDKYNVCLALREKKKRKNICQSHFEDCISSKKEKITFKMRPLSKKPLTILVFLLTSLFKDF